MEAKPEMPRVVLIGITLLALEWVLSAAGLIVSWVFATDGQESPSFATIVGNLVVWSLWGALIYLIATGRQWALWVVISVTLLAVALLVVATFMLPAEELEPVSLADLIWGGVLLLMMFGGFALLLTKPSRAWFAAWHKMRKRPVAWEAAW
jgi:hypothetical protein